MMPPVHRCVSAILRKSGHILLCHRTADRDWYPDCWDLPGGHRRANEAAPSALVRELAEELGITVVEPTAPAVARLEDTDLELDIWVVDHWLGTIANKDTREHDRLEWFDLAGIRQLRLAAVAYLPIFAGALSSDHRAAVCPEGFGDHPPAV